MPSIPVFRHQGMTLTYLDTPSGLWQATLNTEGVAPSKNVAFPPFQLAVAGVPVGTAWYGTMGLTTLPAQMKAEPPKKHKDGTILQTFRHETLKLVVEVKITPAKDAAVFQYSTTVRNNGDSEVTLTQLSSMSVQGVATDGVRAWDDPAKMRVHYAYNTWEGEGQWRDGGLEELGLYRSSCHHCACAVQIASQGSMSSSRFLPMTIIEDRETGKVWYMQIETPTQWRMEIGCRPSSGTDGALFLNADAANERFSGWYKTLKPGQSFTAPSAAVGCCEGGFNEAVRQLTAYRRTLKPAPAWDGPCPVAFNDYMNCLWGNPTIERLAPVVEAASRAGAEIFVMDAGWFGGREVSWGMGLGDWKPSPDRFGESGLQGFLDGVKAKGMIPGIWLEMEVCGEDAELGKKPDDWFLMRHGKRVGGGPRWFLNYANPEVRAYIHGVIDGLAAMGVGFIKNDYNDCVGPGDDRLEASAPDGLITHSRAFLSFIHEVRERHPRLILENCGSGALREDYASLSEFHLQSSSDQEWYYKYPSVIMGSLPAVCPEQLGVWAYPMPLLHDHLNQPEHVNTPEYQASMADGEETAFNMVNGMCGNMYLSGRIDAADEPNFELIKEGVALYKMEREFIHSSYPFWPKAFTRFMDDNTWAGVGFMNDKKDRFLLAVWRLDSPDPCQTFTIPTLASYPAVIRQLYPTGDAFAAATSYNAQEGAVTVRLDKKRTARLFLVERGIGELGYDPGAYHDDIPF